MLLSRGIGKGRLRTLQVVMGDAALSVSIVIPTLNAGRGFGTVLHRIMGQGRVPAEIVCADMGSTDGTRHIVSQFPTARFVEIAEPAGPRCWNRAMEETRGDVVVFLAQDGLPGNGDWLNHLVAPFEDVSVGGVYGRQEAPMGGDPVFGFRLAQRFCAQPHWRRIRVGDAVSYKSLPFFIENAAVRRSVWRGIHFNEHLPVGADRVWARQVVLASYTIAYVPDAVVARDVEAGLKAAYRNAVLTGYTDQHYGDQGGTLWPDSRHFVKRAAWYLIKGFAWGELPYLALEDAVHRYGYTLGRRLDRMSPQLRGRFAPEMAAPDRPAAIDDWAA
jgi:glycosyltransferase involved in cell wall biosynthesis